LSKTRTEAPLCRSSSTIWDPINPAPPVTSTRIGLSPWNPITWVNVTQNDCDIHKKIAMLDVIEIVFKFNDGLDGGGSIAIIVWAQPVMPGLTKQACPI